MAYDLIDIGANLTHDSFDADRDAVLTRASEAGVRTLVVTGSSVACSRQALKLAQTHPEMLFATAGVHPHHAKDLDEDGLEAIEELLAHEQVVAAGECGLDFFRNFSTPSDQEWAFSASSPRSSSATAGS